MRRFRTTIVVALATLLSVSFCTAQQTATTSVPNLIRYGGVMKDANGSPLASQTLGITFSIYKDAEGGVPLWHEVRNVTTDAFGQYNLLLGSTMTEGVPVELFSDQEQRWLSIHVQGQEEQPRALLVSVPYAFKAHEAETLGGLPASAFMKAPTSDSAAGGSESSGTALNAVAAAGNSKSVGGKHTPGTPGYIPIWLGGTSFLNSTLYQDTGANIGVGTITPKAKLDITGDVNVGNSTTYNIYRIGSHLALSLGTPGTQNLYAGEDAGTSSGNLGSFNTFLGYHAGIGNFSGISNTFVGSSAGITNQGGTGNTFVGRSAGAANKQGDKNTYVGELAGGADANDNDNTFVGWESGGSFGSGSFNSFFGEQAGNGSTGSFNTYAGYRAGFNSQADHNTYVGNQAGQGPSAATSGTNNAFFGDQAGFSLTSGSNDTYIGAKAGYANKAGNYDTFVGQVAGTNNTSGDDNTFVGGQAGFGNTSGASNTFVGSQAGFSNNATGNAFFGYQAGYNSNTGSQDTYLGYQAGYNAMATSGFDNHGNTFAGYKAGYGSTPGSSNVGIENTFAGYFAGYSNTIGSRNTFYGANGGSANTTGANNVFAGGDAGWKNTIGSLNTFIGDSAGQSNSSGGNNIYLGFNAGGNNTSGGGNIEIGHAGCPYPCTESSTIRIGQGQTAAYIAGIFGNTPVGAAIVVANAQGQLGTTTGIPPGSPYYIENGTSRQTSANFNISGNGTLGGTLSANAVNTATAYQIGSVNVLTAPSSNLFIGFRAGTANSGFENTFSGFAAGEKSTTGSFNTVYGFAGSPVGSASANTFVGAGAGGGNNMGSNNTAYGNSAASPLVFSTAVLNMSNNIDIGFRAGSARVDGSNNINIGNLGCTFSVFETGCSESNTIRIGTDGSGDGQQNKTYVAGIYNSTVGGSGVAVYVDNNGLLGTAVSSRRFKEHVADMADSSSRLFQLRPVTFFYKPQYDDGSHLLQYGLIAEEVAKVYPDMVAYDRDGAPYTVKYQYLAPMLLNELQKQHAVVATQQDVIKTQQEQIQTQGQQIADLQQRLSRLESLIDKK